MGWSVSEVSQVRVLPALVGVGPYGAALCEPGFAEVTFVSSAGPLMLHQAYVDGQLAGATQAAAERSLRVPVAGEGPAVVVVAAVDAADRLTDFAAEIAALVSPSPSQIRLSWSGGRYLGDGLTHFDVYARAAGAPPDDALPLNGEPIAATLGGVRLSGWGRGGFGRGGWGRSAMRFSFVTPRLPPGDYLLEVAAVDEGGSRTLAATAATVAGYVRPPSDLRVAEYIPETRTVQLSWTASPDLT